MEFCSSREQGVMTIKVSGRLDAGNAPEFEKECANCLDEGDTHLLVGLEDLEYISSAGLRSILSTGKKLKARGGDLILCSLNGMVQEVFDISGFSSIFSIYDTMEAALDEI
ncbi:MAG: STAS domain-containing protein [Desulfohalobiaceae bacterium]|nr:STAS domain-containing protein [Desulfohalobiaceae bacterium]